MDHTPPIGPQHRYELLERIGTGGMAEVFSARARGPHGFEKRLALKRILPVYAADERFQRRLLAEARIAATLSHSNIVSVFDCGRFGDSLYVAMELVDGLDLAALIRLLRERARSIPIEIAVYVAIELLEALDYAHARGVVHRDVSPSNILVSRAGEVKLADFGIAKAVGEDAMRTSVRRVVGKWRYMSPEQTRGQELDARSDLFSAASTLFELFTGQRLFGGEEIESIVRNVRSQELPLPSSVRPALPEDLDAPLLAALAREAAERPARASELVSRLERVAVARSFHATALDLAALVEELVPREVTDVADQPERDSAALIDAIIRSELALRRGASDRRTEETSGTGARRLSEDDARAPAAADEHTGTITLVMPELGGEWAGPLEDGGDTLVFEPAMRAEEPTLVEPDGDDTDTDAQAAPAPEPATATDAPVPEPPAVERTRGRSRSLLVVLAAALAAVGAWWLVRSAGGRRIAARPELAPADAGIVATVRDPPVDAAASPPPTPDAGVLFVTSEPAGAQIAVDGRDLGETTPASISLDRLDGAPPFDVELRLEGYQPCLIAAVGPGVSAPATCALEREVAAKPRFGTIKLFVDPWAEVYLDGRKVGVAPERRLKLPVGAHRLELVNPVLGRRGSIDVKVPSNKTYRAVLAGPAGR